jgi:hypothetical protein
MFWTLLLIHYHADNLNANITTKIAYSTYSKCGQAMTPMLKVVQREYPDAWAQCQETSTPTLRGRKPRPALLAMGEDREKNREKADD